MRKLILFVSCLLVSVVAIGQEHFDLYDLDACATSVKYCKKDSSMVKICISYPEIRGDRVVDRKASTMVPSIYYDEFRNSLKLQSVGWSLTIIGVLTTVAGVINHYTNPSCNPWVSRSLMMFGGTSLCVGIPLGCIGNERRRNANLIYMDWLNKK